MDANKKDVLTIFHLYRKDGSALFLHPFDDLERFLDIIKNNDIEGRYGREPRVESFTLFRNDLYRMIDAAVRRWISETRFIPRFLASAGTFLLSYLLFSFVFGDPLPMVEELLVGLCAAALCYIVLNRIDMRSEAVVRKTQDLRAKVDRIYFQNDPFILEVENELDRGDGEPPERVLDSILGRTDVSLAIENEREAVQLIGYLERRFNRKDIRRQERLLVRATSHRDPSSEGAAFVKWAEARKIDLSLYSLYKQMKKSLKPVT